LKAHYTNSARKSLIFTRRLLNLNVWGFLTVGPRNLLRLT